MNDDILEKRLEREAERHGATVAEMRARMIVQGLDAARELRARQTSAEALSVSVLLVTATMAEHRQLREEAESLGLPFEKRQGRLRAYYHLGQLGSDRVAAIQVAMGAFGADGAAARCIEARAETQATTIILVGTAFGVAPSVQNIGDVLVSESVFLYDDRHAVDDPAARGYALRYPTALKQASAAWVARFRSTADEIRRASETPPVVVGTLLSGGARIESARYRDQLVAEIPAVEPQVIGGEMEAMGAVAATSGDEPGWIIVKGIADFADAASRAKIAENRDRAARAAARVVLRTLRTIHPD